MSQLIVRRLDDELDYLPVWKAMQRFTQQRSATTVDEIWLLSHKPVFTQGLAGKDEHVLNPHTIPIVRADRGGQVTYHGPGQLMIYTLFDLNRLQLSTRSFVQQLQHTIIDYLASLAIIGDERQQAPGVYVAEQKICSIGLRVRKGYSYHGLAFNIHMDLAPFSYINPCGYQDLNMCQLHDFNGNITLSEVVNQIIPYFSVNFGYNQCQFTSDYPGELLDDPEITKL